MERGGSRASRTGQDKRQSSQVKMVDRGTSPIVWLSASQGPRQTEPPKAPTNGDAALKCQSCGRMFNRKRNLQRHWSKVCQPAPDAKVYECIKCTIKMRRRDEIRRHYKRAHGVVIPAGTLLPGEIAPSAPVLEQEDWTKDLPDMEHKVAPVPAEEDWLEDAPVEEHGNVPVMEHDNHEDGDQEDNAPAAKQGTTMEREVFMVPPEEGAVGGCPPEEINQPAERKRWKANKGASFADLEWSAGGVHDFFESDSGAECSDWEEEVEIHLE